MDDEDTTVDTVLDGRLTLRQPKRGHRAGHDAILLAAATPARQDDRVVEFGAGVGTAALALSRRVPGLDLVMVEIDPALARLAQANAITNAVPAIVCTLDVGADAAVFAEAGLKQDSADVVLMNPPFNDPTRQRASPEAAKRLAHMAAGDTLEVWTHAARRILKTGGTVSMIWRADGLTHVLAAFDRGFGSLVIRPVHPDQQSPAIRVLVNAVKGGRAPLKILPPLIINDNSGRPTDEARMILRDNLLLEMAE